MVRATAAKLVSEVHLAVCIAYLTKAILVKTSYNRPSFVVAT